ncbi:BtrH N-terminal domain-containing protein [Halobaculum sp. D14]|uniref:BtrH N-terminal domain-containing protein n=1 Tax=Halobaculum sp. D14 TaxID=3421642 RepID=UPI003EB6B3FC
MNQLAEFDHRTGRDAGSGSLRNLAEYYDWELDEATAFGLGGGVASVAVDRPEGDRPGFLGRVPWLDEQFFESIDVTYRVRDGFDFGTAWENVAGRVDAEEPPLLTLDPAELRHVPRTQSVPAHTVVAIGVGDDSMLVSDPTRDEPVELDRETLEAAWSVDAPVSTANRYVVAEFGADADLETAANRALRETTGYVLDTATYDRTLGGSDDYGDHGPDALRSLAADLDGWTDPGDESAIRLLRRAVTEHGRGAAYRRLYAESLTVLASEAGVGGGQSGKMDDVADEWEAFADHLADAAEAYETDARVAALDRAAATLADIADQEEAFFEHVREEL